MTATPQDCNIPYDGGCTTNWYDANGSIAVTGFTADEHRVIVHGTLTGDRLIFDPDGGFFNVSESVSGLVPGGKRDRADPYGH